MHPQHVQLGGWNATFNREFQYTKVVYLSYDPLPVSSLPNEWAYVYSGRTTCSTHCMYNVLVSVPLLKGSRCPERREE